MKDCPIHPALIMQNEWGNCRLHAMIELYQFIHQIVTVNFWIIVKDNNHIKDILWKKGGDRHKYGSDEWADWQYKVHVECCYDRVYEIYLKWPLKIWNDLDYDTTLKEVIKSIHLPYELPQPVIPSPTVLRIPPGPPNLRNILASLIPGNISLEKEIPRMFPEVMKDEKTYLKKLKQMKTMAQKE